MGQTPVSLSFIFGLFKQNNTIFTTNQYEKRPTSIWCRDFHPQPFKHESSPITTRPGLDIGSRCRSLAVNLLVTCGGGGGGGALCDTAIVGTGAEHRDNLNPFLEQSLSIRTNSVEQKRDAKFEKEFFSVEKKVY